eukprot:SAG11_NODE_19445_length_466_cov_1.125341_1_plen_41_part_10
MQLCTRNGSGVANLGRACVSAGDAPEVLVRTITTITDTIVH